MNKNFPGSSVGKIMKAFGLCNSLHTSAGSLKSNFSLAANFLVAIKDFQVHLLLNQGANPSFVASFSSRKIFFSIF